MKNDFLKGGFNIRKGFGSSKSFATGKHTVCVRYSDGRVVEHENITTPWKYIAKVKTILNVSDAWIKE